MRYSDPLMGPYKRKPLYLSHDKPVRFLGIVIVQPPIENWTMERGAGDLFQISANKRGAYSKRVLIWVRGGTVFLGFKIRFNLFHRDIATLHMDCRDTNNSKKDIQALTMTFNLPYFLVYQEKITTSGSIEPSSVRNSTGQPVFQVGKRDIYQSK